MNGLCTTTDRRRSAPIVEFVGPVNDVEHDLRRSIRPRRDDLDRRFKVSLQVRIADSASRTHDVGGHCTDDPESRVGIVPTPIADPRGLFGLIVDRRAGRPRVRAEASGRSASATRPPASLAAVQPRPERDTDDLHAA